MLIRYFFCFSYGLLQFSRAVLAFERGEHIRLLENTTSVEHLTNFEMEHMSFLEYMLKLKNAHEDYVQNMEAQSLFLKECNEKRYLISSYHIVVYESLCPSSQTPSNQTFDFKFCNDFKGGKVLSAGEDLYYSLQACHSLHEYERFIQSKASAVTNVTYQFSELVVDDLAFCSTFTIPYWMRDGKLDTTNGVISLQLSMSPPCTRIVTITIVVDIIICIMIVLFNLFILIIVAKTNVLSNEFG